MNTEGLTAILKNQESFILASWVDSQLAQSGRRDLDANEIQEQSRSFLSGLSAALRHGYDDQLTGPHRDSTPTAFPGAGDWPNTPTCWRGTRA